MLALIYEYFEENTKKDSTKQYVCKLCKTLGVFKSYKSASTSNLISHLQSNIHAKEYVLYLKRKKELGPV